MASLLRLFDDLCLLANCAGKFTSRHRVGGFSRELVTRFELLEDRTVLSTFTVLNLADSGDGSLRAAIAAAQTNPGADLIDFAPAVQGTITLTSGRLLITGDVTIVGPGANMLTVSGNHSSQVFNILGGPDASTAITVDISGLTISDGRANGGAAGVTNLGFSDVTLSHVVLSGNESFGIVGVVQPAGGAIRSDGIGANLTLLDSLVTGNAVHGVAGPFIGAFGAGIATTNGATLAVANSTITGNRAISDPTGYANGGGIHLNVGSSVTLMNSTIANNEAAGGFYGAGGGGISNSRGFLSITNSTLTGNRAVGGNGAFLTGYDYSVGTAFGGAIFNVFAAAKLEVRRTIISGNQAIGGNNGTHEAPNTADVGSAHGGAIFNSLGAEATIRDSTIEHNRAIGGHSNTGSGPAAFVGAATGGAIDNSIDAAFYGSTGLPRLTITNSIIRANEAVGGDANTATGGIVFVGVGLGGGIANYLGATSDVADTLLAQNRAVGGRGNSVGGGSGAANLGAGGAIFNAIGNFQLNTGDALAPSVVNVERSLLVSNQAHGGDGVSSNDGGDAWGGAIASLFGATTNANRTVFSLNRAVGGRGGAGANGGNAFGGAMLNDDTSLLVLTQSLVTLNQAQGGSAGAGGSKGEGIGGGVYNLGDFDLDEFTLIRFNKASTNHDNVFGDFEFIY
jgi:hypothetical protein